VLGGGDGNEGMESVGPPDGNEGVDLPVGGEGNEGILFPGAFGKEGMLLPVGADGKEGIVFPVGADGKEGIVFPVGADGKEGIAPLGKEGKLGTFGKFPGIACGLKVGMGGLLSTAEGVEGKLGNAEDGIVFSDFGGAGKFMATG